MTFDARRCYDRLLRPASRLSGNVSCERLGMWMDRYSVEANSLQWVQKGQAVDFTLTSSGPAIKVREDDAASTAHDVANR